MKIQLENTGKNYKDLLSHISETYIRGREQAAIAVNTHLVETYWKIGQYIVEFEQKGKVRAEYGTELLKKLSKDLKLQHGKGFSLSNLKRMRQFYLVFPKGAELPHLLSWTHYVEILKIPETHRYSEKQLEDRIIEHLKDFLLELGKGFAFIARQYRIPVGNRPHAVDLVFYHRILKCFVLIDLKREEAGYEDVGQMNMYLGYFENEENTEGDNPPIGIVLAKDKDELLVQYAMHNISSQLFVNKYQLYLPNKEEFRKAIEEQLNKDE